MVSELQIKFVELIATGYTIKESAEELEMSPQTCRGWLKNHEVLSELSRATDVFSKEVLKSRSRQYRLINKKILDAIIVKLDNDALDTYEIEDLIKMLDKTVSTMRNDEDSKKQFGLNLTQNNININNSTQEKFKQKEFVDKFSELLVELDPIDIQNVVEAKNRADVQDANARKGS